MPTGLVEKWHGNDLADFGPVFPFVDGTEFWFIICVLFWLGWHVWQGLNERRTYEHDDKVLADPQVLRWAVKRDTMGRGDENARPGGQQGGGETPPGSGA